MKKPPAPRNPEARAMLTSGAFKQRVVKDKKKDPQLSRRSSKTELKKDEKFD